METLLQFCPSFTPVVKLPVKLAFNNDSRKGKVKRWSNVKLKAVNNEKDGVLLGAEKDESSSIVGFQFISKSPADDSKVSSSHDIISNKEEEVIVDDDLAESTPTKVTYNIVFVTSEAAPYSKTGGLGDVCGSLPIALAARGHRVMVVTPRYLSGGPSDKKFASAVDLDCRIKVSCSGGVQDVAFFHEYRAGVDWVFVDHPSFHRPGNPYGDAYGAFGDNQFRFTLLCHAACEAPLVLPLGGFTYGEKCLFLANDWHAGLVPVLLAAKYRPYGVYKDARSIVVIHNLAHQGVEPASTYSNFGLPPEWYGALGWVFPTWARTHALDTGEAVNILKGAIVTADRILTVSQGYSWEITTPEGGNGLDELLTSRKTVVNGITNGIDINEWNPSLDEHISSHYSLDDLTGKVVERALFLWNKYIQHLIMSNRQVIMPIVFSSLQHNSKNHWNRTVLNLTQSVLKMFHEADEQLVISCQGKVEEDKSATNAVAEITWDSLEKAANDSWKPVVGNNSVLENTSTSACVVSC